LALVFPPDRLTPEKYLCAGRRGPQVWIWEVASHLRLCHGAHFHSLPEAPLRGAASRLCTSARLSIPIASPAFYTLQVHWTASHGGPVRSPANLGPPWPAATRVAEEGLRRLHGHGSCCRANIRPTTRRTGLLLEVPADWRHEVICPAGTFRRRSSKRFSRKITWARRLPPFRRADEGFACYRPRRR